MGPKFTAIDDQKLQSFTRSLESFNIVDCYVFCNFATMSCIFLRFKEIHTN